MFKQALLFAILATAKTQLVSEGSCVLLNPPNSLINHVFADAVSNKTTTLYEIKRLENTWITGQCASWEIIEASDSLSLISKEVVNRKLIQRNGTVTINPDFSFHITFPDFSSNFTLLKSTEEYIVMYACSNEGKNKQELAWVLGFKTTISANARNETNYIIKNKNLDGGKWVEILHTEESCKNGGVNHFTLFLLPIIQPILVSIIGFLVSK